MGDHRNGQKNVCFFTVKIVYKIYLETESSLTDNHELTDTVCTSN